LPEENYGSCVLDEILECNAKNCAKCAEVPNIFFCDTCEEGYTNLLIPEANFGICESNINLC